MSERAGVYAWLHSESERQFTRLECGLLGALFASIAMTLMTVILL